MLLDGPRDWSYDKNSSAQTDSSDGKATRSEYACFKTVRSSLGACTRPPRRDSYKKGTAERTADKLEG